MSSRTAVLAASPRYRSCPDRTSSAGQEAVELAASAGLILDPWQAAFLDDALGERADGRWSAMNVGLIVPRQNGKGAVLEARELAGLFLFDERLIVHTAHEFKTAVEAFRRIRELIESTPDLDRRVFKMLANNNDMSIELRSGQRLRFIARSGGSGRGFTGDTVILDEAYELSSNILSALVPTMSARPNPQLWWTSSAPKQTVGSEPLREFCRGGRRGAASTAYVEFCAGLDVDPDDREALAEANPGLNVRITEEFVYQVERPALGDDFLRERFGVWFEDDKGERVIPAEKWAAGEDQKSGPVGPVSFALAVSFDRKWSSFGVAGKSGRGGTHVEVVDSFHGTEGVVTRAKDLLAKWGGRLAVASGSPAASLLTDLRGAGVDVVEVSTAEQAQACGMFYDAVMQATLKHLGQPVLTVAVDGADRKLSGDAWVWSRRTSLDISPLEAVTLAKWVHDQHVPATGFVDLSDYE